MGSISSSQNWPVDPTVRLLMKEGERAANGATQSAYQQQVQTVVKSIQQHVDVRV